MIDWHSHILPKMDDGSNSSSESVEMVKMLAEQGIDTVLATSHFYANCDSVESYLNRRAGSYERLKEVFPDMPLRVVLGAEVAYYNGISRLPRLEELRIEGTKYLLLEMPMDTWTGSNVRELFELAARGDMHLILAHIERYYDYQEKSVWEELLDRGILMQSNASFFNKILTRSRALKMLRDGQIHLIGSDCHTATWRAPEIGESYELIEKKLGKEFLDQMDEYGHSLLGLK